MAPSLTFSNYDNDFLHYEKICPDSLRSLITPGMTAYEYTMIRNEIMDQEDEANLQRATLAKQWRSFSPVELNHLEWLSPKDLAHIARIEHFSETRMGVDMIAWCNEVFERIRNEQIHVGDINAYDAEILTNTMMIHALDEFREVSNTDAFGKIFYCEDILNFKTGRLF